MIMIRFKTLVMIMIMITKMMMMMLMMIDHLANLSRTVVLSTTATSGELRGITCVIDYEGDDGF